MSRCPHCATELEAGARFCGACGKKVDQQVELPAAPPVAADRPLEEPALGPPQAARRGDISGTIRPHIRDPRNDNRPAGGSGLESAAMTLFQSAKSGGG